MPDPTPDRPIIIRRKKVVKGRIDRSGAWKVAYADFLTAMMAFFMLMWLLNATTEQQRMGLADYFSPSIPVTRVSGGGAGAFGGDDVFSDEPTALTEQGRAGAGASRTDAGVDDRLLAAIDHALSGAGMNSGTADLVLGHLRTHLTDEGLVIEVFSRPGAPLFDAAGRPVYWLPQLAGVLAELFDTVANQIAIEAHVPTAPVVRPSEDRFNLTSARAGQLRSLLEAGGMAPDRLERLTGHGDTDPATENPMSIRNDRLEIILLRGVY